MLRILWCLGSHVRVFAYACMQMHAFLHGQLCRFPMLSLEGEQRLCKTLQLRAAPAQKPFYFFSSWPNFHG